MCKFLLGKQRTKNEKRKEKIEESKVKEIKGSKLYLRMLMTEFIFENCFLAEGGKAVQETFTSLSVKLVDGSEGEKSIASAKSFFLSSGVNTPL